MRKIISLSVALAAWFCAVAQESSEEQPFTRTPEVVVTARGEINPHIPGYSKPDIGAYDYAGNALYLFLDGYLTKSFSYSASFHLLAPSPGDLYSNAFHSDVTNFVDWAYFSWQISDVWGLSFGKDMMSLGTQELTFNDVDVESNLYSMFWYCGQPYQWGAKVFATLPSESTTLTFHFTTSPYGEKPFSSKLFAYMLNWTGEYDWYSPNSSIAFVEYERGEFIKVLSLGNRFTFGRAQIDLDYIVQAQSLKNFFGERSTLSCKTTFQVGRKDHWEIFLKGGWEYDHTEDGLFTDGADFCFDNSIVPTGICPGKDYVFYGGGVNCYPLSDRRLRLQVGVAANNYSGCASVLLGATYNFNLTQFIQRHKKQ